MTQTERQTSLRFPDWGILDWDSFLAALDAELRELEVQKAAVSQDIATKTARLTSLSTTESSLVSEILLQESRLSQLTASCSALARRIDELQQSIKGLESRVVDLREQKTKVEGDLKIERTLENELALVCAKYKTDLEDERVTFADEQAVARAELEAERAELKKRSVAVDERDAAVGQRRFEFTSQDRAFDQAVKEAKVSLSLTVLAVLLILVLFGAFAVHESTAGERICLERLEKLRP